MDPTAILNPSKIKLIKEIDRVFEAKNSEFVCMCTDESIHTSIAKRFEERGVSGMEERRTEGRARALAMIVTSLMIGITLNAVATSHIIDL